jgi:hypothetical protein
MCWKRISSNLVPLRRYINIYRFSLSYVNIIINPQCRRMIQNMDGFLTSLWDKEKHILNKDGVCKALPWE